MKSDFTIPIGPILCTAGWDPKSIQKNYGFAWLDARSALNENRPTVFAGPGCHFIARYNNTCPYFSWRSLLSEASSSFLYINISLRQYNSRTHGSICKIFSLIEWSWGMLCLYANMQKAANFWWDSLKTMKLLMSCEQIPLIQVKIDLECGAANNLAFDILPNQ